MDTNEQIRMLEASLGKELDDLKNYKKKVEILQMEYENKLKALSAILNKGDGNGPTTQHIS